MTKREDGLVTVTAVGLVMYKAVLRYNGDEFEMDEFDVLGYVNRGKVKAPRGWKPPDPKSPTDQVTKGEAALPAKHGVKGPSRNAATVPEQTRDTEQDAEGQADAESDEGSDGSDGGSMQDRLKAEHEAEAKEE